MIRTIIILPTYNERENVRLLIELLEEKIFPTLPKKFQMNILVVDDGSPDRTAEVIRELSKKWENTHLLMGEKRGLGAAYVRGMNYAIKSLHADVMFQMDADLQHDPYLIPLFLNDIENGSDFVIGSRYILGGSIPKNWALNRKIYSTIGNWIVRFGLMVPSIHDWTSGYRAIRSDVIKRVGEGLSKFPGYTFQIALLYRAHQAHFVVSEVPLNFGDRTWGKSKLIPLDYIYNVIRFVILYSTFMRYLYVGGMGFVLQFFIAYVLEYFGLFPGFAAALGAEAAVIWNYNLNNMLTFAQKRHYGKQQLLKKFFLFQSSSFGAILIQFIVVSLATLIYGRHATFFGQEVWIWANVGSILFLVIPYNFFVYNRYIWKTHEK